MLTVTTIDDDREVDATQQVDGADRRETTRLSNDDGHQATTLTAPTAGGGFEVGATIQAGDDEARLRGHHKKPLTKLTADNNPPSTTAKPEGGGDKELSSDCWHKQVTTTTQPTDNELTSMMTSSDEEMATRLSGGPVPNASMATTPTAKVGLVVGVTSTTFGGDERVVRPNSDREKGSALTAEGDK